LLESKSWFLLLADIVLFHFLSFPLLFLSFSHTLFNSDADLILFGLRSREHADFYTLRQEPRQMKLYNSQKLGRRVMDLMGSQDSSVLDDFCVLSLFMGNDYFPKLRYYNIRQALSNFKTAKQISPEFKIWDEEAGINFNFLANVLVNPVTMGPNSNGSPLSNKNVPPHLLHPRTFLNHINDLIENNLIFRTDTVPSGGAKVTIYLKDNKVSEPKFDVSTGQASYHAAASLILSPRVFFDFLEQDPHLGIHLQKVKWEWGHKMKHDREHGVPPPSPSEGEAELEEEEEVTPNRGGFTRVIEAPSKELANQRYVEVN
jgi:hypothetical protein